MTPKDISVIIPVYNAEPFLSRCLDSLLDEGPDSMEVILIDDGSTDASAPLCARYAAEDSRIIWCSQNNQGAVAARNRGMDMARGAYLLFIDADDSVSPGYVRVLHNAALTADADIAFCNVQRLRQKTVVGATEHTAGTRTRLSDRLALLTDSYYPGAWAKIYRRKLLEDIGLRFLVKEGYFGFAEDMLFALYATYSAPKIIFCPEALYYYWSENENSICNDPSLMLRNNNDRLVVIDKMLDFAEEKKLSGEDLLPVLQAVENHLRWGGLSTLNIFLKDLDSKNLSAGTKSYFYTFAKHWKSKYGFQKYIKSKIKTILLMIPFLSMILSFWNNRRYSA